MNDVHLTCCVDGCGIEFCLPRSVYERRLEDHKTFYCPNGHSQHFTRPSPKDQKIATLERRVEWWRQYGRRRDDEVEELKHAVRSLRSRLAWARRRAA